MATSPSTCAACGARLSPGDAVCDLCGTPVDDPTPDPSAATPPTSNTPEAGGVTPAPSATDEPVDGIFCNQCGWRNPVDARFCSRCGTKLQAEVASPHAVRPARLPELAAADVAGDAGSTESEEDTLGVVRGSDNEKAVSRQVGILVGAGLLLVVALFLITAVSSDRDEVAEAVPTQATQPSGEAVPPGQLPSLDTPLPPQVEQRVAELRTEAATAEGEAKAELLAQMVNLLEGSGRLDLAAPEQEALAQIENTPDAWRHAGNLYYDWMSVVQAPEQKIPIAQRAIAAYEEVLELEPNNLDARTDMAVAYLNTNNPMQGVEEITSVLAADSLHIPARFNYGIMLAMIGRVDKARTQFELVKEIVDDPESPYYQRADGVLEQLSQQGGSS